MNRGRSSLPRRMYSVAAICWFMHMSLATHDFAQLIDLSRLCWISFRISRQSIRNKAFGHRQTERQTYIQKCTQGERKKERKKNRHSDRKGIETLRVFLSFFLSSFSLCFVGVSFLMSPFSFSTRLFLVESIQVELCSVVCN